MGLRPNKDLLGRSLALTHGSSASMFDALPVALLAPSLHDGRSGGKSEAGVGSH